MQQRKEKRCLWRVMKVRTEDLNGWVRLRSEVGVGALLYSQQGSPLRALPARIRISSRCCSASAGASWGIDVPGLGRRELLRLPVCFALHSPLPGSRRASLPLVTPASLGAKCKSFLCEVPSDVSPPAAPLLPAAAASPARAQVSLSCLCSWICRKAPY